MSCREDTGRELDKLERELDAAARDAEGLRGELAEAHRRIAAFERGEYICQKCWLRQDDPKEEATF